MHCHLCQEAAIGMCRQCFKFYCSNHGEIFCENCQQKGWTTNATPAVAAVTPASKDVPKEATKIAEVAKDKAVPASGST